MIKPLNPKQKILIAFDRKLSALAKLLGAMLKRTASLIEKNK